MIELSSSRQELLHKISSPLTDGFHEKKGTKLHYVKTGAGPPLILIHGGNIGWIEWINNIDFLANYFTLYMIELPGAGLSSPLPAKGSYPRDLSDILSSFIESYFSHTPVFLLGHSIGGWCAVQAALSHARVKKLVLVNPVGFSRKIPLQYTPVSISPLAYLLAKTVMTPSHHHINEFLKTVCYNKKCIQPYFVKAYASTINQSNNPFTVLNRMMRPFGIRKEFILQPPETQSLPETLIIHGRQDPLISKDAINRAGKSIKFSKITVIEECGHVPPLETPNEFNKLVLEFSLSSL